MVPTRSLASFESVPQDDRLSELSAADLFDLDVVESVTTGQTPEHFARCGYVPLPGLLTELGLRELRSVIDRLVPSGRRKDFEMECMDGTPRHMSTLGGVVLAERAPGIVGLYHNNQLRAALGRALGLSLTTADDPVERHVLNMLHEAGDTHGYHVDDYPIALVLFAESPDCESQCGRLEFCPVGQAHEVATRSHQAGDAYLLRSDLFTHRVQPIHEGCRRTVLNFAYGVDGHDVTATPSASLLYD